MSTCQKCGEEAVVVTERNALTPLGVLGSLVFVLGGCGSCVLGGPVVGLVVAAVGLLIGLAGNRRVDVLKCTSCGAKRRF